MLAEARARLSEHLDRLELVHADLARPLPPDVAVDAVVSSATFHWIADHRTLFGDLAAVLGSCGRISAHCGGASNIASVVLGAHLEEVAEAERPDFVRAVASRLPGPPSTTSA